MSSYIVILDGISSAICDGTVISCRYVKDSSINGGLFPELLKGVAVIFNKIN